MATPNEKDTALSSMTLATPPRTSNETSSQRKERTTPASSISDVERGTSEEPQAISPSKSENGEPSTNLAPPPNPYLDPKSFPDGGWTAWSTVVGGFFALLVSFGWINCVGIFQDYYQRHQLSKYTPSTVAWVSSCETFMMFFGGPIIGRFYDAHGPRYILLLGTFLHVFGLMMTSLCKEYYQFILAQGICSPIGASMIFYSSVNSIATWFHRNRALATGIAISGSSTGGVIFPIMVSRLIPQVGYAWAMRIVAFLILGCLVVTNLTVQSRIPPMKKPFRFMDFIEPLQEAPFAFLCAASFFTFFGMFLPFTYLVLQATSLGMAHDLSQYLISILNAASVFGRILPGFVGDRLGRFNVMVVLITFTFVIVVALWIPANSNTTLIIFAALYGFGTGAIVSLPPALIAQICDIRKLGSRVGTNFFIMSFAALTGAPVGGLLVSVDERTGEVEGFLRMQIFAGVVMGVGACCYAGSRICLAGLDLRKKV